MSPVAQPASAPPPPAAVNDPGALLAALL
jgi:hypothetical protein